MTKDKQLELLDALLRYADEAGNENPQFYKNEILNKLNVCEHVFNIMHKQFGDKFCRMVDPFEGRYAINVNKCLELRNQIIQAKTNDNKQENMHLTILATLIGTLFVLLVVRI